MLCRQLLSRKDLLISSKYPHLLLQRNQFNLLGFFIGSDLFTCVPQVTEEKLKKLWITVDAQSNQKDDVKKETVYCLDDDNETEVQAEDTIQGNTLLNNSYLITVLELF